VRAIPAIVRQAIAALRIEHGQVGALAVASRGVWTAPERRRMRRALAGLAPAVDVMSDVEAAYRGALGATTGVLLLVGTGSIALGRDADGRWHRAGGLGPLLGDEGSAFWIGRAWLTAAGGRGGGEGLRRVATAPDTVARVASVAPAVLRAARRGHRGARAIARDAQRRLAVILVDLARRIRLRPPLRVSWAGRLMEDPEFRAGVWRQVRQAGLALAPSPPETSAVDAVARVASARLQAGRPSASRPATGPRGLTRAPALRPRTRPRATPGTRRGR
jgi:glucosamine kinase